MVKEIVNAFKHTTKCVYVLQAGEIPTEWELSISARIIEFSIYDYQRVTMSCIWIYSLIKPADIK